MKDSDPAQVPAAFPGRLSDYRFFPSTGRGVLIGGYKPPTRRSQLDPDQFLDDCLKRPKGSAVEDDQEARGNDNYPDFAADSMASTRSSGQKLGD